MEIKIKNVSGSIIYTCNKKKNTLKKTLEEAAENGIDLCGANLIGCDLSFINLKKAHLDFANMSFCNLSFACLDMADLHDALIYHSDLLKASLVRSNLFYTDFYKSELFETDFSGAAFFRTGIKEARIKDVKGFPSFPMDIPEGEFIGWKKLSDNIIAKLLILEDSNRSRSTGFKCRCSKARVLELQNLDGTPSKMKQYLNVRFKPCLYKEGEIVESDSWDDNRWKVCSHGIHFFLDRQSAVEYW